MRRRLQRVLAAAVLMLLPSASGQAEAPPVNTIHDVFLMLRTCWKPPPAWRAHPGIDITVIVSFNRNGDILGHPKITYESEQADDNDRLMYRIAVMEALQRARRCHLPRAWPAPLPAGHSQSNSTTRNPHPNPQRREHG